MSSQKNMVINVIKNGVFVGYLKSISLKGKPKRAITQNIKTAKKMTEEEAMSNIDLCMKLFYDGNMFYSYSPISN